MEARAEQPSPSQEKGRGNQLEPVPPIRHLRRLHPGWFCGIERSRSTFSSAFAPARFLRPGWFCGTNASAGGPVLSVPTIWVAFGFVYARVGLLDVLLSRTDVPGVLWIWNSFRSPLQETPDTKSRRTRDSLGQNPDKECRQMRDGGSPPCPGLLPYLPELLVLERRRPTSVILRTPAYLVFFCSTANPGCAPFWVVDYFKGLADDTGLP